jgi:hypothetical protein
MVAQALCYDYGIIGLKDYGIIACFFIVSSPLT